MSVGLYLFKRGMHRSIGSVRGNYLHRRQNLFKRQLRLCDGNLERIFVLCRPVRRSKLSVGSKLFQRNVRQYRSVRGRDLSVGAKLFQRNVRQ